jgi:hypothetical protein
MRKITRNVRVSHPVNGKRYFQTEAMTAGELLSELDAMGLTRNGYNVREGCTRTLLDREDVLLPSNFEFRREITNDLAIIYTSKEPVKSGAEVVLTRRMQLMGQIDKALADNGLKAEGIIPASWRSRKEEYLERYLKQVFDKITEIKEGKTTPVVEEKEKITSTVEQEVKDEEVEDQESEEDEEEWDEDDEDDEDDESEGEEYPDTREPDGIRELTEQVKKLNLSIDKLYDAMNNLIEMRESVISDEDVEKLRRNLL